MKTIAIMQINGAEKAFESLQNIPDRKKLESYYLYHSLLGELNSRLKKSKEAKQNFETAMELTKSETERKMLKEKIVVLLN